MTIKDNILSYLKKNSVKVCDDCLTKELDFNQRQVAFSNCRDLHNKGLINRDKSICNIETKKFYIEKFIDYLSIEDSVIDQKYGQKNIIVAQSFNDGNMIRLI